MKHPHTYAKPRREQEMKKSDVGRMHMYCTNILILMLVIGIKSTYISK